MLMLTSLRKLKTSAKIIVCFKHPFIRFLKATSRKIKKLPQSLIIPIVNKEKTMQTQITKIIAVVLPLISLITAQPSFPSDPNQAPIGGLGVLAAAGGAWAVKKLRDKHKK